MGSDLRRGEPISCYEERARLHPVTDRQNPPHRGDHLRAPLNQRLRRAFLEGSEEDSRRLGRGLTGEELERVLGHYPGDLPLRPEQ